MLHYVDYHIKYIITIIKVPIYECFFYCNKSWFSKFVGEVSEELDAFITLDQPIFYVDIGTEFSFKIQPNMFLNGSSFLGGWYIIKIYGKMVLIYTLP